MANNNKHTGHNVPALRFPEFSGEWEKVLLSSACEINPKTGSLDNQFLYIDLESVVKGSLVKRRIIEKDGAPSRAQRVLKENDILYQCVRPYQLNNYFFEGDTIQCVASTGYAQLRTTQFPLYIFQALHTKQFTNQVLERCTGTNYPAINSSDLGTVEVPICSLPEQVKIGSLLALIDSRIKTQSKIIEEQETLLRSLRHKLFNLCLDSHTQCRIGDILSIGSGKDYQHLREGEIPVYGTGG
ncbi:MAG: restriction endonuclease subunit S, partial [Bacteroidales bacterium]|nr:restriction endonuclease subunit S [Bacteroidales bacterium]